MGLLNNGKLKGRVAVITGASRLAGIGAAICRALAEEGADIFFTYWINYDQMMPWGANIDEQEQLSNEIRQLGVRCEHSLIDLSNPANVDTLLDHVQAALGKPAILVNNACYSVNDSVETITAESLDAHYAVNIRAIVLLSAEFTKRFDQGRGGRIISITSGQSLGPMVGEIAYAATKGAIDAFTRTFAAEVGSRGITVNAVNPGPTDTGWMTPEIRHTLGARVPLGRVGLPRDAARLVAFLAAEEAEWITGQILHSDGGFR
jgi:3-oxoacyl-[acyl-carrier protein] reductase